MNQRSYIKGSLVDFEEDEFHEFKGHRNIGAEDIPPWCWIPGTDRRSRKPASRALAAFLNAGRGGTLYLGIIDEGVVKGIYMTEYQMDHVRLAVKDLFSRYRPQVPENCYDVQFIPVVAANGCAPKSSESYSELDSSALETCLQKHLLRTYDFCWCDKDLSNRINEGKAIQEYVIEIVVFPQKNGFSMSSENEFFVRLPPVYTNEEGKCFFRKSASCIEYSSVDIVEMTTEQVKLMYEPVLQSLRQEIRQTAMKLENRSHMNR